MTFTQIAEGIYMARTDRAVAYAQHMSLAMVLCMRLEMELKLEEA